MIIQKSKIIIVNSKNKENMRGKYEYMILIKVTFTVIVLKYL